MDVTTVDIDIFFISSRWLLKKLESVKWLDTIVTSEVIAVKILFLCYKWTEQEHESIL